MSRPADTRVPKKPRRKRKVKSLTTTSRTRWDCRQPWPFLTVKL